MRKKRRVYGLADKETDGGRLWRLRPIGFSRKNAKIRGPFKGQ